AIDISDGFIAEAGHLARSSGVTIELFRELIPLPFSGEVSQEEFLKAVTGGDDYQLLFSSMLTPSEIASKLGSGVAMVGRAVAKGKKEVVLYSKEGGEEINLDGLVLGYQHL